MTIESSIQNLKQSIRDTAEKAGRSPEGIRLVLVTKTVEPPLVLEAYQAGERDFGENRVQEWQEKSAALPKDIRWHLVGHLQTNKVKYVIGQAALIHSLDRLELADAIEKQARAKGIAEVPCLVQVNMSREETKSGCAPEDIDMLVKAVAAASPIRIKGLMTIGPTPTSGRASPDSQGGPLTGDPEKVRDCFRKTRELLGRLKQEYPQHSWEILSMGMSDDFRIAIEEGSNMLRIGSLLFGPRGK
jgi:pyridoxal phosphate enzyme (YggS family)